MFLKFCFFLILIVSICGTHKANTIQVYTEGCLYTVTAELFILHTHSLLDTAHIADSAVLQYIIPRCTLFMSNKIQCLLNCASIV